MVGVWYQGDERADHVMLARFILAAVLAIDTSSVVDQVCVGCPTGPPAPRIQINDGDWSVAIVIGEGVVKSEAELVVRAFRRGELVDRHPRFPGVSATASYIPPASQASQIGVISVSAPASFRLPDAPGRFLSVTTYNANGVSGNEYLVAIRDGRVELLASLVWNY